MHSVARCLIACSMPEHAVVVNTKQNPAPKYRLFGCQAFGEYAAEGTNGFHCQIDTDKLGFFSIVCGAWADWIWVWVVEQFDSLFFVRPSGMTRPWRIFLFILFCSFLCLWRVDGSSVADKQNAKPLASIFFRLFFELKFIRYNFSTHTVWSKLTVALPRFSSHRATAASVCNTTQLLQYELSDFLFISLIFVISLDYARSTLPFNCSLIVCAFPCIAEIPGCGRLSLYCK